MDFHQLTKAAETAVDEGRVRTARTLYEGGFSRFPEHTAFLGYNLGALLQMQVGDGTGAREAYARGLAGREQSVGILRAAGLDELESNICENSMLLSLSFEEYERWASRLEKLRPENPILIHQRPRVREWRERGHAWWAAMLSIAKSGYDADPAKDPGRYAASAAILQLLLLNRRQLRVPRDEHRVAVISYATLTLQAWSKCGVTMGEAGREEDLREFAGILEQAVPLVEEFVTANPADADAQAALGTMREALGAAAQHSGAASQPVAAVRRSGGARAVIAWGQVAAGTLALGAAGYVLRDRFGWAWPWGALVGALIAAVLLERVLSHWRARTQVPAPQWQISAQFAEACQAVGISGLRFEMVHALIAPDQSLAIRFTPLDVVPEDKRENAYMALRCVVALSLPTIAANAPAVQLIDHGRTYDIGVGSGVRVTSPAVRRGKAMLGPLTTVGEIEGDAWWVGLQPASPDLKAFISGTQKRVLQPLVAAFDRLRGPTIVLPG
jgi:hypothetical protein